MVSIRKVVGLMCCGCLLCLGLSSAAQAGNAARAGDPASLADPAVRKGGQAGVRSEQGKLRGGHRIEGDLLRVEGEHYFVMGQDGKEVRLYIDRSTKKTGNISQGDRIVAVMNDQNHARSIRAADMADHRHDNADRTTDSTVESGKTGTLGQ